MKAIAARVMEVGMSKDGMTWQASSRGEGAARMSDSSSAGLARSLICRLSVG
jgi:hypothetical protein